jgi:hypothetical protein
MAELLSLAAPAAPPHALAWSLAGTALALASRDGQLSLYDPRAQPAPVQVPRPRPT